MMLPKSSLGVVQRRRGIGTLTPLILFLWKTIFSSFLISFVSLPLIAAEFSSNIESEASSNSILGNGLQIDYVIQVLLSLLVVVGVIVLLSYLLKRFNFQLKTESNGIRILSIVPLGGKDRLLLVGVGEEQLLIGSSPGSVQKLHTLEKPIDLASGNQPVVDGKSFMSIMNSIGKGQQA